MMTGKTIDAFRDAMREAGLCPPDRIDADGQLHRFHVEGDRRGTLNGWYLLHLDGRAAGVFGSWKTGLRTTWANGTRLGFAERHAFAKLVKVARTKAEAERQVEHELCAIQARAEWSTAYSADPAHPYLVTKAVKPHGLRQIGNALIVPLYDERSILWNVQRIYGNGRKRFRTGRAGGLFSPIGDLTSPMRILVCEGWATGATLHEEIGASVLCAMNAGNLLSVAKAARKSWAGASLVICADNDRHTAGNPGVSKATEAAKAAGARLIVPTFPDGALGSDFNDLAQLRRKESRHA